MRHHLLSAWLPVGKQPENLENRIMPHYKGKPKDYYHAIGRYLVGELPLEDLLSMIQNVKQRCEFAYYIGLKERLTGNYRKATQWYHLCRQTLQENNGEFHWASNELFYWSHMGLKNRHRVISEDIEAYQHRQSMKLKRKAKQTVKQGTTI